MEHLQNKRCKCHTVPETVLPSSENLRLKAKTGQRQIGTSHECVRESPSHVPRRLFALAVFQEGPVVLARAGLRRTLPHPDYRLRWGPPNFLL
jgi:hypothetical protein